MRLVQCGMVTERYAKRLGRGLCGVCGSTQDVPGKRTCLRCLESARGRSTRNSRKRAARLEALGLCNRCGKTRAVEGKKNCRFCLDRQVQVVKQLRAEALAAYGNRCACPSCPEKNPAFLTIDHTNNDGAAHRAECRSGRRGGNWIYNWAKRNNYPSSLQLLCFNCNCARQIHGGVCPHNTTQYSPVVDPEPTVNRISERVE
jgi:hypothetical protein